MLANQQQQKEGQNDGNIHQQTIQITNSTAPLNEISSEKITNVIQISDENSKLTIQSGIVVIKRDLPLQEQDVKRNKKMVNSKIHTTDSRKQANANGVSQQQYYDEINRCYAVFAIEDHLEVLRNNCKYIQITGKSRVNIYALKKLIKIVSKQLISLTIEGCIFYEDDKSALQDLYPSTYNKMLRELSFVFQIKALQLPNIKSIDILLLRETVENDIPKLRKNNSLKVGTIDEKQQIDELLTKYNCDRNSSFVDFEIKSKNLLMKKFQSYKSKEELAKYLIYGNSQGQSHTEDRINYSILEDINEHVNTFKKYIQGSLIENSILLIKGYCLEDPIAFDMIQNMILKNKKVIKTVIFKEAGTIPYEFFLKIIDALLLIKQLDSIAFFDAQPKLESKSYCLLKDLFQLKTFRYIVLNRSSFDLAEYKKILFEENPPIVEDYRFISTNTVPKHYSYYLLNQKDLLEFTPFEYCIKDLLFSPNHVIPEKSSYQDELLKYQIGHLVKRQEKYSNQIKQEIQKYQNDKILTYEGTCEQIFMKYSSDVLIKSKDIDQQTLEVDIRTLIKHSNYYAISKAIILTKKIQNMQLKGFLLKEIQERGEYYQILPISSQSEITQLFLQQSLFQDQNCTGLYFQNYFMSTDFPLKVKKIIPFQYEGVQKCKDFIPLNIEEIFQNLRKKSTKSISLSFNYTHFSINAITSLGKDDISKQAVIELQVRDTEFYMSEEFEEKLKEILIKCVNNFDISLEYIQISNQMEVFQFHMRILEGVNIKRIDEIHLEGRIDEFSFSYLNPKIIIKKIKLQNVQIRIDSEEKQEYSCEEINLIDCTIQALDFKNFKLIKAIEIENCSIQNDVVEQIFESLLSMNKVSHSDEDKKLESLVNGKQQISIYLKNRQISLNKNLISRLINQRQLLLFISSIDEKSQQSFEAEIISHFPPELNQVLITQYCCKGCTNDPIPEQNQKDKLILMNEKDSLIINNQESQSQSTENKIDQHYQKLKDIYLNNELLDEFLEDPKKKNENIDQIPECCQKYLDGDCQNISTTQNCLNLSDYLRKHSDKRCLMKTSIFQNPFQLRNVHVRFNENTLINDPIIYDYQEIDWIEKLIFTGCKVYDISQVKLIDILIQCCPQLKVLKWNGLELNEIVSQDIKIQFSPLKKCQILEKLTIVSKDETIDESHPLLDAILQSNLTTLKQIKLNISCYEEKIDQLLEQNSQSLISLDLQEVYESINKCQKLEKLVVKCNSSQTSLLSDIIEKKPLKILTVVFYDLEPFNNLQDLMSIVKNDSSHLEKFTIRNQKNIAVSSYLRKKIKIQNQEQRLLLLIQLPSDYINENEEEILLSLKSEDYEIKRINDLDSLKNSVSILSVEYLQELHLTQQEDYLFLNKLFECNRVHLTVLSFKNCDLTNESLIGINFNRIPKTMKSLNLSKNEELSSLKCLESLLLAQEDIKYKQMILDLSHTSVQLHEYAQFIISVKKIILTESETIQDLYPIIQYICKNNIQEERILMNMFTLLLEEDGFELSLFLKMFFNPKIDECEQLPIQAIPFIISPLNIISSQVNYNPSLQKIYNEQKQDNRFSLFKQIGNKYLLFLSRLGESRHDQVLGYSKNYHGSDFYVQKLLLYQDPKNLKDTDLTLNDHLFNDYLLLLQMQERLNINQIHLPISLEVSYSMLHNKKIETNIDEIVMIENISRIPPSEITIDDMSVQFIKIWYVINTISPLTFNTIISNIDSEKIYNTSLGNYLTQHLHRNNFFRNILKGTAHKYRYDQSVQFLAEYFEQEIKKKKHVFILCLFPLYLFACIFGIIFFSLHFSATCGQGISWYSYLCYLVYGCITFVVELLQFKKCLNYIHHLIPQLELDLNPNFVLSYINSLKRIIIDTPWINQWYIGYSYSFIQSQISRFDNFTNVAFLYSTYECKDYAIFYIALSFMAIPFLYSVFQFLKLIFKPNQKYSLPTASLDSYYMICNIVEFRAVSDILDLVSPSNVISIRGRMFNARIISFFIRIICENIPLVIIQIYNLSKKNMTSSLVISLIFSLITFISLLINVLTITPSTLNQEDFNKLNEKKKKDKIVEKYESRLQTFENEIFVLQFYDHLKQLRLKYQTNKQSSTSQLINYSLINKYNSQIEYFQQLFDSQKDSLKKFQKEID